MDILAVTWDVNRESLSDGPHKDKKETYASRKMISYSFSEFQFSYLMTVIPQQES